MICDECQHVEKMSSRDEHGNIHITWQCKKTLRQVFYQIIYSETFLQGLRSGELYSRRFYDAGFIPKDKSIHELKNVEVLHVRKAKNCRNYRSKSETLGAYCDKP